MNQIAVKTLYQQQQAIANIKNRKPPFTINIKKGVKRSLEQNNLQFFWYLQLQTQGDQTATQYRAESKLHVGVPILRAENEEFREKYDLIVRPLPYEHKLALMVEPFDFPVTSLMDVDQNKRFLDGLFDRYTTQGFVLTEPA